MPPAPREPAIYSGFVISHIGQSAGQRVPMDFKVAQSCVASGTHAWEEDETPLGKNLKAEIESREAEKAAQEAADREHYEKLKSGTTSVTEALINSAKPVHWQEEDGRIYLARPFPNVVMVEYDMLEKSEDGKTFDLTAANAIATYEIVEDLGGVVVGVLKETDQFDEVIPADWRDRHFLQNIAAAKKIRGMEQGDSLRRPEAEAIIEEWIKADDQIRENPGGGETEEARGGEDGKRIKNGEHAENGDEDGRERAKEAEKEFVEGDE